MSTVTLSKPHCAITSAEKPDGIASQAFTTALPEAHACLTLLVVIGCVFPVVSCFEPGGLADGPLDAHFADAYLACGIHYRRPGVVRQGDAVFRALGTGFSLRIARNQHGIDASHRLGRPDEVDIARNLAIEEIAGVDHLWVHIDRKHTVGKLPVSGGRARPGQRAAEQLADERQPRTLVLAKGPDRAGTRGVIARSLGRVRSVQHAGVLAECAV